MSPRGLRSARQGTARLVATDASVATDRIGLAWVGDDGTWWMSGSPVGYPGPDDRGRTDFIIAAELRAVAAAVACHPSRLLVLTDSLAAAETARACGRDDQTDPSWPAFRWSLNPPEEKEAP